MVKKFNSDPATGTIGIYAGSFNPWHRGHEDILNKALQVFDIVVVAVGHNPDKQYSDISPGEAVREQLNFKYGDNSRVVLVEFSGFLKDIIKNYNATALIRGLRDGNDLAYERNQQYWNEDLGVGIPTTLFICDREYGHISSSAIRNIKKLKEGV